MTVLSDIRYLIIDVDGVLRRNRTPLPGACEFLPWLDRRGIGYRIVTNNSAPRLAKVRADLANMGIVADEEHILTSAAGTGWFLRREAPGGGTVYIIGEDGPREAILSDGLFREDDQHPDFVVVGLDRAFTYEKLKRASLAIRNGARFVAANVDATYPMEGGVEVPGAGSLVAAVRVASGVEPIVVGKPQSLLLDMALSQMRARREATAVLGDRLETDIAGGIAAGMHTIMVLTGISTREHLAASPHRPDFVFDGLPELMKAWDRA